MSMFVVHWIEIYPFIHLTLPPLSKPVADAGHHTGPASGLHQAIGHLKSWQEELGENMLYSEVSETLLLRHSLG